MTTKTKNLLLSLDIQKVENGFIITEMFLADDVPNKQHIFDNIDAVIAFVDKTFNRRKQ